MVHLFLRPKPEDGSGLIGNVLVAETNCGVDGRGGRPVVRLDKIWSQKKRLKDRFQHEARHEHVVVGDSHLLAEDLLLRVANKVEVNFVLELANFLAKLERGDDRLAFVPLALAHLAVELLNEGIVHGVRLCG